MENCSFARSRLDGLLVENKQLKKRLEAAERDNRELKLSVYELSARLSAALARCPLPVNQHGHQSVTNVVPGSSLLPDDVAARLRVIASDLATSGQHGIRMNGSGGSGALTDGRHLMPSAILSGHTGAVYVVAFAPLGRLLASGSYDMSVRCWATDEVEPRETVSLQKHTHNVSCLSWSTDARALISGSYDHTVRLWDVERALSARCWHMRDSAFVQDVAYHPISPHVFAVATTGHALHVLDTRNPSDVSAAHLHNDTMVNSVLFLPAGEHCITGDKHGAVKSWDLRLRSCVSGLYAGDGRRPISHVALSEPVPTSSRAAAAMENGLVSGSDGGSVATSSRSPGGTHHGATAQATETRLLAVNSYDDTLRVYDHGFGPLKAPAATREDVATPVGNPPGKLEPNARDGSRHRDSEFGASNSSSPSPSAFFPAPGGNDGGTKMAVARLSSCSQGGCSDVLALEGDEDEGGYATCVHALVGHRNRSYPIRSAMRVGAEYSRCGAARRAAVVDACAYHSDDDHSMGTGCYHIEPTTSVMPNMQSTVLLAMGSADSDAYLYDISGRTSSGACPTLDQLGGTSNHADAQWHRCRSLRCQLASTDRC